MKDPTEGSKYDSSFGILANLKGFRDTHESVRWEEEKSCSFCSACSALKVYWRKNSSGSGCLSDSWWCAPVRRICDGVLGLKFYQPWVEKQKEKN